MSTCATCRHWIPHRTYVAKGSAPSRGRCDHISRGLSRRAATSSAHATVTTLDTTPDFGCVEHEAERVKWARP